MAGIPLDKAELLALFLETFFYGIFFTLFCITHYVLFSKEKNGAINRLLVSVSITMMLLATGHLAIDVVRIMEAFLTKRDSTKGGTIGYYLNLSNPLHTTKTVFYVTQTLIGDGFVTWRCFVINGRRRFAIAIPAALLTGSVASGCAGTFFLSTARPGQTVFDTGKAWITAFFVLTLCQNVYCTASIVYRIWYTDHTSRAYRRHSLTPVLFVIIESGALYSSALLALLGTYLSGTNGQYPALDIVQPFVGIVFHLIIIQISAVTRSAVVPLSVSAAASEHPNNRRTAPSSLLDTFPLHTVSLDITQSKGTDRSHSDDAIPLSATREKSGEGLWHPA